MRSNHQSKQARNPHERRHRAGQGGPKAKAVNREEKQTDIGNPWNDKINEMLGIGHRFGDPTVPVDQNESQDGESRKGGHKGRYPTAAETAEPRRQTDDGAPDQEIQQISHLTRYFTHPPSARQDGPLFPWPRAAKTAPLPMAPARPMHPSDGYPAGTRPFPGARVLLKPKFESCV